MKATYIDTDAPYVVSGCGQKYIRIFVRLFLSYISFVRYLTKR